MNIVMYSEVGEQNGNTHLQGCLRIPKGMKHSFGKMLKDFHNNKIVPIIGEMNPLKRGYYSCSICNSTPN